MQQLLGCATDLEVGSKMKSTAKLVRLAMTMSKVKMSTMTACCGDCIVSRHQCHRAEYSLTCTYSPTLACSFTYHINDINLRIDTGTFTLKWQDINIILDVSPDVPESAAMSKR